MDQNQKGVDVQLLATKSQLIERAASEMDTLTESVRGLQGPLEECWNGDDKDACVIFINNLTTKMGQMSEQVRKIEKWINDVSEAYQRDAAEGARAYQL